MADTDPARLVLEAEASYLLLLARRVLNFIKKADDEGEEYHDLQPLVNLQCGYAARLRFEKGPAGQYRPVVTIGLASVHHAINYGAEGYLRVASEILGGPAAKLEEQRYCLAKDK